MKSQSDSLPPPRLASWLISLFVPHELSDSISGDLLEEFSALVPKSSVVVARRWYWRQTLRALPHFWAEAFRRSPWTMVPAILGGFLLHRFTSGLSDKFLAVVTDRYLAYWSAHFQAYLWLLKAVPLAHLIGSLFVGCMVALAAKGREMIAAITLALIPCALIAFSLLWLAQLWPMQYSIPWLLWQCADPLVIVAGGAIVRSVRSNAKTQLTSS